MHRRPVDSRLCIRHNQYAAWSLWKLTGNEFFCDSRSGALVARNRLRCLNFRARERNIGEYVRSTPQSFASIDDVIA